MDSPGPIPNTVLEPAAICVRPLIPQRINIHPQLTVYKKESGDVRVLDRPRAEVQALRLCLQREHFFFVVTFESDFGLSVVAHVENGEKMV